MRPPNHLVGLDGMRGKMENSPRISLVKQVYENASTVSYFRCDSWKVVRGSGYEPHSSPCYKIAYAPVEAMEQILRLFKLLTLGNLPLWTWKQRKCLKTLPLVGLAPMTSNIILIGALSHLGRRLDGSTSRTGLGTEKGFRQCTPKRVSLAPRSRCSCKIATVCLQRKNSPH